MTEAVAAVDDTLRALADPVRRRTVELLTVGPRPAGDLAAELGVSASVMSKHLAVLREGGLVEDSRAEFDSRVRIYDLRPAPMADLRAWLRNAEEGWSEQLIAFRDHLERS